MGLGREAVMRRWEADTEGGAMADIESVPWGWVGEEASEGEAGPGEMR